MSSKQPRDGDSQEIIFDSKRHHFSFTSCIDRTVQCRTGRDVMDTIRKTKLHLFGDIVCTAERNDRNMSAYMSPWPQWPRLADGIHVTSRQGRLTTTNLHRMATACGVVQQKQNDRRQRQPTEAERLTTAVDWSVLTETLHKPLTDCLLPPTKRRGNVFCLFVCLSV